jgi:hypothetical protein
MSAQAHHLRKPQRTIESSSIIKIESPRKMPSLVIYKCKVCSNRKNKTKAALCTRPKTFILNSKSKTKFYHCPNGFSKAAWNLWCPLRWHRMSQNFRDRLNLFWMSQCRSLKAQKRSKTIWRSRVTFPENTNKSLWDYRNPWRFRSSSSPFTPRMTT